MKVGDLKILIKADLGIEHDNMLYNGKLGIYTTT